jgi:hypothetical protein
MTPDEIFRQLGRIPGRCDFAPYEAALLAAVEQREAITPELIAAIDRVSANPAHYQKRRHECLHVFAFYLLAQFREIRALDSFIRFFALPGEDALDLTGDMVTENGAALLASVCGGDPAPLLRLAHDESANEYPRGQAIDGLLVQSIWGERPREAVIAELRGLFDTLAKPDNGHVWAMLVSAVSDFNALELLPQVRRAFAEGLVDEGFIGLEDIDPDVPGEPEGYSRPSPEELFRWFCERNAPIDAVAECSTWLCFGDETAGDDGWEDLEDYEDSPEEIAESLMEEPFYQPPSMPYIAPVKVGRNDPCPCGSGRKYKKCCGK